MKRRIVQNRIAKYIADGIEPEIASRMARQEVRRMKAKERIKAKKELRSQENPPEPIAIEEKDEPESNGHNDKKPATKGIGKGLRLESGGKKAGNKQRKANPPTK